MLAGHLAAAFMGTRIEPRVPLATAVGAAFALDLLWPVLLLAGLETVAGLVALIAALWATQPWTPPPPSSSAVAWGAPVLWLLLPWSRLISRRRALRGVA